MGNMNNEHKSYLYVIGALLLWSAATPTAKLVLKTLSSLQVLFYSSLIAFVSLLMIALLQRKITIIKQYRLQDYRHFAIMGFLGIFLYYNLFYYGLKTVSTQQAVVINYSWPIWVVIFAAIILKEQFNLQKIIALIMGFFGIFIVISKGNVFSPTLPDIQGVLFIISGAASYGVFSVLGKKDSYDKLTAVLFYFMFSWIFITIQILLFSEIPKISLTEFCGLVFLGLCVNALGYTLWFLALKYGDTAKISSIVFLTPFFSLIFIYLLLGEPILFSSLLGLSLIISGIVMQSGIHTRILRLKAYGSHP
jgi:drug/metabolite transporter (DMT)-like permease